MRNLPRLPLIGAARVWPYAGGGVGYPTGRSAPVTGQEASGPGPALRRPIRSTGQEAARRFRILRGSKPGGRVASRAASGASPDQTPITPSWAIGWISEPLNPVGEVAFTWEAAHDCVERRDEGSDGVS
jgi:hypothetical protein